MHVLGLRSRFAPSMFTETSFIRDAESSFCHDLREICQFSLVAILVILAASPRTAYAATISSPIERQVAVTMADLGPRNSSRVTTNTIEAEFR